MPRMIRLKVVMLLFLLIHTVALPAQGSDWDNSSQRLILNIYLDKTGKALVTGYVSDPTGLPFLNASQYRYENDTLQLYALTDALTRKEGDLWNLQFVSQGYYYDFHLTFYLPGDLLLKRINNTSGLRYLLSASNESLVADVRGYEVQDPGVTIEYLQPLQEPGGNDSGNFRPLQALAILLALGSAVILIISRRKAALRSDSLPVEKAASPQAAAPEETDGPVSSEPEKIELAEEGSSLQADQPGEAASFVDNAELEEDASPEGQSEEAGAVDSIAKKEIEVTSEMAAVMETLTPRERAILQALIRAGGKMTQADLRYETRTPKSSLSGILLSLERRKLITKKEWGRTNVIELSEWFLFKKNGS